MLKTIALGSAYFAGLAAEVWKSQNDIKRNWAVDSEFVPQMEKSERDRWHVDWEKAIMRAMG